MLCGYCFRNIEKVVVSECSGIEVCEDCYWIEVVTEEVNATAEIAGENGSPGPGPGLREPGPGLPGLGGDSAGNSRIALPGR
ncbi:MAG: hypothetical protein QHH75_04935 [Bacillota bacterium]|nr:hypothetical protein [Bacillota bacterium]